MADANSDPIDVSMNDVKQSTSSKSKKVYPKTDIPIEYDEDGNEVPYEEVMERNNDEDDLPPNDPEYMGEDKEAPYQDRARTITAKEGVTPTSMENEELLENRRYGGPLPTDSGSRAQLGRGRVDVNANAPPNDLTPGSMDKDNLEIDRDGGIRQSNVGGTGDPINELMSKVLSGNASKEEQMVLQKMMQDREMQMTPK